MALVDTSSAWEDANEAWEAGYAIVCSQLNEVLRRRAPDLLLTCNPPISGVKLSHCLRRFKDALRRTLAPLPDPDIIRPWSLGFVNGEENQPLEIDGSTGADEQLAFICDFLRNPDSKKHWKRGDWKRLIISAIESRAKEWRGFYAKQKSKMPRRKKGKPASANQLMLDTLQNNPEARGWTVTEWQKAIHKGRATIHATKAWKELDQARELQRIEYRNDRRRGRSGGRKKLSE